MTATEFRVAAKRHHPDMGGNASDFQKLVEQREAEKLASKKCKREGCENKVRIKRRRDGKVTLVRQFCGDRCRLLHLVKHRRRPFRKLSQKETNRL